MGKGDRWTREETILALHLYWQLPFGKIDHKNPQIIALAKLINRTSNSVAMRLSNFAHLDPTLPQKGLTNISNLDKKIWHEFFDNWNDLAYESERLLQNYQHKVPKEDATQGLIFSLPKGTTQERITKTRVNQAFFRKAVLSSYEYSCCITGVSNASLLVASHIVLWAADERYRMNPSNGLCLNALHDKAFDKGLITLDNDYRIVVAKSLRKDKAEWTKEYFLRYEGERIRQPKRFTPDAKFLEYHRNTVFDKVGY